MTDYEKALLAWQEARAREAWHVEARARARRRRARRVVACAAVGVLCLLGAARAVAAPPPDARGPVRDFSARAVERALYEWAAAVFWSEPADGVTVAVDRARCVRTAPRRYRCAVAATTYMDDEAWPLRVQLRRCRASWRASRNGLYAAAGGQTHARVRVGYGRGGVECGRLRIWQPNASSNELAS